LAANEKILSSSAYQTIKSNPELRRTIQSLNTDLLVLLSRVIETKELSEIWFGLSEDVLEFFKENIPRNTSILLTVKFPLFTVLANSNAAFWGQCLGVLSKNTKLETSCIKYAAMMQLCNQDMKASGK
jgi:hypothetical protein